MVVVRADQNVPPLQGDCRLVVLVDNAAKVVVVAVDEIGCAIPGISNDIALREIWLDCRPFRAREQGPYTINRSPSRDTQNNVDAKTGRNKG